MRCERVQIGDGTGFLCSRGGRGAAEARGTLERPGGSPEISASSAPPRDTVSLATRIEVLLRSVNGARLSLRGIAERLGLACGHDGEGWQNVCRLAHALAKLAEFEKISHAFPDAHWIEPPRDERSSSEAGAQRRAAS